MVCQDFISFTRWEISSNQKNAILLSAYWLCSSPVVIVIPASEQQCCKEPSKSPGSLQFKNVILSAIVVLTTCVHSSLQMSVDTKLHTSRQIAFGGSKCDEFPHGG